MDVTAPGALAVVTVQKVAQYVDQTFGGPVTQPPSRTYPHVRPQEAPVDRQGTAGRQRCRQVGDGGSGRGSTDVAKSPSRPSACGGSAGVSAALHAVRDVDLESAAASGVPILGPNGAGKTTLFNVDRRANSRPRRAPLSCSARTSRTRRPGSGRSSGSPARTSSRGSSPGSASRTTSISRSSASRAARCAPWSPESETARCASGPRRRRPGGDRPQARREPSARSPTASTGRSPSLSRSPQSRRC